MQAFWDLASVDGRRRVQAASALLETMVRAQAAAEETGDVDPPEPPSRAREDTGAGVAGDSADVPVGAPVASPLEKRSTQPIPGACAELAYAVRRLVRGLASGRQGARQGFSTALAVLLAHFDFIPTSAIVDLMSVTLRTTRGMKGEEERDNYFGILFGYNALIASGRIKAEADTSSGKAPKRKGKGAGADAQQQQQRDDLVLGSYPVARGVVSVLSRLAERKSYLGEACAETILRLADAVPGDEFFERVMLPKVLPAIGAQPGDLRPDGLWLILKLRGRLVASGQENALPLLRLTGRVPEGLYTDVVLAGLAECLKSTTSGHPHIHSVWYALLEESIQLALLRSDDESKAGGLSSRKVSRGSKKGASAAAPAAAEGYETLQAASPFHNLWRFVDQTLFESSHERKCLGFRLVELAQGILSKHEGSEQGSRARALAAVLLSPGLRRCLANSLASDTTLLYKNAKRAVKAMVKFATMDRGPNPHANGDAGKSGKKLVAPPAGAQDLTLRIGLGCFLGGGKSVFLSKQAAQLTGSLDADGLSLYLVRLMQTFCQPLSLSEPSTSATTAASLRNEAGGKDKDQTVAEARRTWAAEQMLGISKAAGKGGKSQETTEAVGALQVSLLTFFSFHSAWTFVPGGGKSKKKEVSKVSGELFALLEEAHVPGPCQPALSNDSRALCAKQAMGIVQSLEAKAAAAAHDEGRGQQSNGKLPTQSHAPHAAHPVSVMKDVLKFHASVEGKVALLGAETPLVRYTEGVDSEEGDMNETEHAMISIEEDAVGPALDAISAIELIPQDGDDPGAATEREAIVKVMCHVSMLALIEGVDSESAALADDVRECAYGLFGLQSPDRDGDGDDADSSSDEEEGEGDGMEGDEDENEVDEDDEDDMDDSSGSAIDVLVSTLLRMLSRESSDLRSLVNSTFAAFSAKLTPSALAEICTVIASKRPLGGARDNAEQANAAGGEDAENTGMDEDDSSDGEDIIFEDGESKRLFKPVPGLPVDVSGDGVEEDSSDSGSESSDPIVMEGKPHPESNGHSAHDGDESESEEDDVVLDDEAMFALDKTLGRAIRQAQERLATQNGKVTKEQGLQDARFKLRVLDLVEVLIKKEPNSPLLLELPLALLNCVVSTAAHVPSASAPQNKALSERASGILRHKLLKVKGGGFMAVPVGALPMLQMKAETALRTYARKGGLNGASSAALLHLCRAMAGAGHAEGRNAVLAIMKDALRQYMEVKSTRINHKLLSDALEFQPTHSWLPHGLLQELAKFAAGARTAFLRVEAIALLAKALAIKTREPAAPGLGSFHHERGEAASLAFEAGAVALSGAPDPLTKRESDLVALLAEIARTVAKGRQGGDPAYAKASPGEEKCLEAIQALRASRGKALGGRVLQLTAAYCKALGQEPAAPSEAGAGLTSGRDGGAKSKKRRGGGEPDDDADVKDSFESLDKVLAPARKTKKAKKSRKLSEGED